MNPLLLVAAAFMLPKLVGEAAAAKKLTFNPIGVKIIDGKLNLIVQVTNPGATTINIDGVFLSFFIDFAEDDGSKTKIGSINIPKEKSFKITKRGTSTIYLPITLGSGIGLLKLTSEIIRVVKKKGAGFKPTIIVAGTIVSLGLTVPISETVPLGL